MMDNFSHNKKASHDSDMEPLTVPPNKGQKMDTPVNMENELIDQPTSIRSIFGFTTREHTLTLTGSLLVSAISGITKPAQAIFVGKIFNDLVAFGARSISSENLISSISKWSLYITVFGVISWLLNSTFFAMWLTFGEQQAKSAREKLFDCMLIKEISWYDLRSEGIGAFLSRVAAQVRDLQLAASQPFGFIVGDFCTACAAIGLSFYYSWKLTLVTLAVFPIAFVLLGRISQKMKVHIEAQKKSLTQASKFANTALVSIDTVKAYNGQEHEVRQYVSAIKQAAESYLKQASSNALQMGITRFVILSMFVQGFWFGIFLVDQGLSAGAVLTTFYACLLATEAAETLLPQWIVLARGMSAGATLKYLLLYMQHGRKVVQMGGNETPAKCVGDVEINNVSFAYPSNPHQLVLENVNLFFPAGEMTFVIGKSGSGKSTLSNLLLKFYEPLSGDLSIDEKSVQTLNTNWLRENITLVQQQSALFNGSLYQNIALGSSKPKDVTRDEIIVACQASMLQEVVKGLPEGLETIVAAGSMSGGQTQRVALARARLRDTPILILDEATSALDPTTRSLVMGTIREWRKGKTTIVITHNISQVQEDDFAYLLEHGRVAQEGYRRDLAKDINGPFARFTSVEEENSELDDAIAAEDERNSFAASGDNEYDTYQQPLSTLKRLSSFLRPKDSGALSNNRRMSFGMYSTYANVVRAEDSVSERDEKDFVSNSRSQTPDGKFPYQNPLWDGSYSVYRPLSSTARTLGLRPRSIISMPPENEPEADLWKLPSTIPNGIEMGHSYSITGKSRRSLTAVRESRGTGLAARTDGPKRLVRRFERFNMGQSESRDEKAASLTTILKTVWPTLICKGRLFLVTGFFFAFIHAAATPLFSYALSRLFQVFYDTTNQAEEARKWSLTILAISIVDGVATYFMHYLLEYCGQAWVNSLRIQALDRILSQPRSWFDSDKNNIESLNESLDRNAEEMRNLVGRFAGYVFVAVSMVTIAVLWALILSWKLTLVGLSSAPFIWGVTRCFEYTSGKWEGKSNKSAEVSHRIFTETFMNIRVVRAFTLEKYFQDKHSAAVMQTFRIGVKRATYAGAFFGLSDSNTYFITALIGYYSAVLAANGGLSVSSVLTVASLLMFGIGSANGTMAFIPQISQSRMTASRLLELANLSKEASHEAIGIVRLLTPLPIKLSSLSFTYPSRPTVQVLHKVSLTFPAGSCTSIVGSSGSGKSTIASLLLDLYPPDKSSDFSDDSTISPLTFAGLPITELHTPSLRSHIAVVPQTPVLFPTTIAENIAYGLSSDSPDNNEDAIIQAARNADVHDFIQSLPNGYQTLVGTGGMGLSGGQAQRIVIARALIRRPQVLILDEATSALDNESASMIRATVSRLSKTLVSDRLNERMGSFPMNGLRMNVPGGSNGMAVEKGMTVIIITHNVEMMRVAERIVVLEMGRVVEVGGFDELVRRKGAFSRLVRGVEYRRDLDTVVEVASPVSTLGGW